MPERLYGPAPDRGLTFFHAHLHPLPELPALTHVHEVHAAPSHRVPPHIHETHEITYVASGRGEWVVEGNRVPLARDDLYIVQPGELHSGGADPSDPYRIFVVGLDPAGLPLLGGGPVSARPGGVGAQGPEARARIRERKRQGATVMDAPPRRPPVVAPASGDAEALDALRRRVIPGAGGGAILFRRLLAELDAPCAPGAGARALRLLAVQAILVELLVFVARCHAGAPPPSAPVRPEVADAMAWMRSRVADPPLLAEVARRGGLSPSHFAGLFKRETGRTPLEFLTAARVEEAARRLRERPEASVTRIAAELGFGSSQYFSTVFRRHTGCTPREWRRGEGEGGEGGERVARAADASPRR